MLWDKPRERQARRHQESIRRICREIVAGQPFEDVFGIITPGGGKSAWPVIAAAELIQSGWIDKILWLTPRHSLQEQAESAFLDAWWRRHLIHDLLIRSATNEHDPSRGLAGYSTTYQAIAADSAGINALELQRYRYAIFLDEFHHLERGGIWHRSVDPLVRLARLRVFMTGADERGDGKQIAYMPYREHLGGLVPDYTPTQRQAFIHYSRRDALAERAIIPLFSTRIDCRAEWVDRKGESRVIGSFEDATRDLGDAIYTALRTDYAFHLLGLAVKHWLAHRGVNPRAKLLVVAATVKVARQYLKHLRENHGIKAGIAVSEDADAYKNIKKFKKCGEGHFLDCLVTVGIAYEGLDNPPITHIACLTHIRSAPWIEQMLARATRFDEKAGAWETQFAWVFAPDDAELRLIFDRIDADQQSIINKPNEDLGGEPGGGSEPSGPDVERQIDPLQSAATRQQSSDHSSRENLGYEESEQITGLMERHGILGVPPLKIKKLMLDLGAATFPNGAAGVSEDEALLTPSERDAKLRTSIQKYCAKLDRQNDWEPGEANRRVFAHFGKSRDLMTTRELMQVWAWLQDNFAVSES